MTVLVTGGAGYIGSHMVWRLVDEGENVVILDNLSTGFEDAVPGHVPLIVGDAGDPAVVKKALVENDVTAVIHFAGSIVVPESVSEPLKYYRNNTSNSRTLIECCVAAGVHQFVFSSTAAVYGAPETIPVDEGVVTGPLNPYGWSKLMTEQMLQDTSAATNLRFVALRYFNVAGADIAGRAGQRTPKATHLIKVASEAAIGKRACLEIFGTDYDTPDGTCIRDYIHVTDLIEAHMNALSHLRNGGTSRILNCGYGRGYSVLEVVDAMKRVSGRELIVNLAERRPGDSPEIVADSSAIKREFGWQPQHDNLDTIVRSAYEWEKKLNR